MTSPKGIRSTNSVLAKLQFDPKFQKRMVANESVGMDKRAVSNINRVLGQEVAAEQQKFLGLDRAGAELARRKDTLEMAKKSLDFQKESFNTKVSQREAERDFKYDVAETELQLRKDQLTTRLGQFKKQLNYSDKQFGMEFGLGLIGTGTTIYREVLDKRQHEEYMKSLRELISIYKKA